MPPPPGLISDDAIAAIDQDIAANIHTAELGDHEAAQETATNQNSALLTGSNVLRQLYTPQTLPPRHNSKHKIGHPCPEGDPKCHFHHSTDPCHTPWQSCGFATRAIKASFHAKSAWKGAPTGWNESHAKCIKKDAGTEDMCKLHHGIYKESLPSHKREMLRGLS